MFCRDKGYDQFLKQNVSAAVLSSKKGQMKRYPDGEVMTEHKGIHLYTYGQSKGLGMDHHEKLFVIKIDAETNTVWVGDEKYLYRDHLEIKDMHLINEIKDGEVLNVKIRYQHKGSLAKVKIKTPKLAELEFLEPQRAVTPGQAAVFYREKHLLGGGWII